MSRFNFSGLHHAAFATADMDKTVGYWRDLLGFNIVYGLVNEEQKQYAFRITGQMLVFFFEWKDVKPVKPKRHGESVKGPFIFDHLAIHMANQAELFRLQDQLACAELPVSDVIDHGFLHSVYTFDPNGIPLEFTWVVPDVDLDRHPLFAVEGELTFQKPELAPQAGVWPVCEEDDDDIRVILPGRERNYFP